MSSMRGSRQTGGVKPRSGSWATSLCAATSRTRIRCIINITFRENIHSRWCCIDRLSRHRLSGLRELKLRSCPQSSGRTNSSDGCAVTSPASSTGGLSSLASRSRRCYECIGSEACQGVNRFPESGPLHEKAYGLNGSQVVGAE
jgi:hypothetical protein